MKQIIFVFLIFLYENLYSQNKFSIQANVMTDSKEKISVGDVLLCKNNKIVEYTSVVEGEFSFKLVTEGRYLLKIVCVGYKTYEKELMANENKKLEIILKESCVELDEVSISATKRVFENRRGNLLANIEGTILSKETNTVALLSKLSYIQVSTNGEQISILGKGNPLIYIGGQRISSAKYEAAGRAVLLITKRRTI